MKLIVQIPCFNEEQTLRHTIADIPRVIPGVEVVEVLVIDDGSTDETVRVAREAGADHVVQHKTNKGLAQTFRTGIDSCLRLGADIIVNTDGDNQYAGSCIPMLIQPILDGEAEVVIGDRQVRDNPSFSWTKKRLQMLGSFVVRRLSRTNIPDTVSGFRAFSREVALNLNIVSPFSYTIEMLIQAGTHQMTLTSVPIKTNSVGRQSRLLRSIPHFILHSLATMVRVYTMYHPLKMFVFLGTVLAGLGAIPLVRFLYFYGMGDGSGHVQSLILGSVLLLMGFVAWMFGLVADLTNFNRQLLESTLKKVRILELEAETDQSLPARKTVKLSEIVSGTQSLRRGERTVEPRRSGRR